MAGQRGEPDPRPAPLSAAAISLLRWREMPASQTGQRVLYQTTSFPIAPRYFMSNIRSPIWSIIWRAFDCVKATASS